MPLVLLGLAVFAVVMLRTRATIAQGGRPSTQGSVIMSGNGPASQNGVSKTIGTVGSSVHTVLGIPPSVAPVLVEAGAVMVTVPTKVAIKAGEKVISEGVSLGKSAARSASHGFGLW